MAAIESEAYFDGRLAAIRISNATATAMKARGWSTLGDFAYASSYVPGQGPDDAFVTGVLEALLGEGHALHVDAAKLRRLYFEAHAVSIADLRRRTERSDTDQPIKMPTEERIVRLARLKRRLMGMDVEGVLSPSHALVHLLTQMLETGNIKYVSWNSCTFRDQEVLGIKKINVEEAAIVADSGGYLKKQKTTEVYEADTSTDLLLTHALTRRALAFELANICPYEVFGKLNTRYFKEYMKPPLSRYSKVSLEQIESCDKFVFVELATRTAGGIAIRPDGVYPVQEAMTAIMASAEFTCMLMQLPAAASRVPKGTGKGEGKRHSSRSRSRKRRITEEQSRNRKANEAAGKGGRTARKGGGKGGRGQGKGGKSNGKPFNPAIETSRTPEGQPICYAHNTVGCPDAAPGERCSKGWHRCWRIGCTQNHPGNQHS